MTRRTWRVLGVLLAMLLAAAGGGAVAVAKSKPSALGSVDKLLVEHRSGVLRTTSSDWEQLVTSGKVKAAGGSLSSEGATVVTRGPMSIDVTVDVKGGPAELRVLDNGRPMKPSKVRIPGSADGAYSYTFVGTGSKKFRCHSFKLEWRSPSGVELSSSESALSLIYNDAPKKSRIRCA